MKKNSIDLFIYLLKNRGYLSDVDVAEVKAMHKEEIINATIYGDRFEGCYGLDSEQYYNETFGGNK